MENSDKKPAIDGFSFDFLSDLDLSQINWEKEIKYVGALTGSAIGSFVSSQMSWSLGWRIASVVSGSYSGAILAALGYHLVQKMTANPSR